MMTGIAKIEAAFTKEGTPEIPVTICYERLFIRDHIKTFSCPWWYWHSSNKEQWMALRREVIEYLGQDWLQVWQIDTARQRRNSYIAARHNGVFRVSMCDGTEGPIPDHPTGGPEKPVKSSSFPKSKDEIDAIFPISELQPHKTAIEEGRWDLAAATVTEYGSRYFTIYYVSSPLWTVFNYLGFENVMMLLAVNPSLAAYAAQKQLAGVMKAVEDAAKIGARGIWIEECFTDMVSPDIYKTWNLPVLRDLVEFIQSCGLKSIYYFTGNPNGKMDMILSAGADAIALEEGKKTFLNDIEDIVSHVGGRCAVLGNLDSIGVLQDGTESGLRAEIKRQIAAGRKNKSRFIMCTGSPVTPATPIQTVRRFCRIVKDYGML